MTHQPAHDDPIGRRMAQHRLDASITKRGDRWVLSMARLLPHPADRVWAMLTDPDRLAAWSPVVPDRPLTSIGPATARESQDAPAVDAEVLVCRPPRELVHRWGPDILRWLLEANSDGTRLTLEHAIDDPGMRAPNAAGWHLLLAVLDAALAGEPVSRVVGHDAVPYDIDKIRAQYAERWHVPEDSG